MSLDHLFVFLTVGKYDFSYQEYQRLKNNGPKFIFLRSKERWMRKNVDARVWTEVSALTALSCLPSQLSALPTGGVGEPPSPSIDDFPGVAGESTDMPGFGTYHFLFLFLLYFFLGI